MYSNKINPDYKMFYCDFCGVRTDCGTMGDDTEPSYCQDCEPVPPCVDCDCDSQFLLTFEGDKAAEGYCAACLYASDGVLSFADTYGLKVKITRAEGVTYRGDCGD